MPRRGAHRPAQHPGAAPRGRALVRLAAVLPPPYDAAVRQSLDCAERALTGTVARPADWGWYVRLLRAATARVAPEPAE